MAVDEMVEKKSRRRRNREEEAVEEIEEEGVDEARGITAGKGRVTPGKRNKEGQKEDNVNIVVRTWRDIIDYLRGVQDELDKVVWPTREELVRLTRIVLSVTIASSIVLGIIALVFTLLFAEGIKNPIVFVGFAVVGGAVYLLWRQSHRNTAAY